MGLLKRDIAEFSDRFPTSQREKPKQQKPGGLTQVMNVHSWKRKEINMEYCLISSNPYAKLLNMGGCG